MQKQRLITKTLPTIIIVFLLSASAFATIGIGINATSSGDLFIYGIPASIGAGTIDISNNTLNVVGDNQSWNQSLANLLYANINTTSGNLSWNKSYADTLYASINSTTYYPTSYSLAEGTLSGNNNLGNLSYYDNQIFNITEGSGANSILFYVNFTNVTKMNTLYIREYYLGSTTHNINIEIYDYGSSSWEQYNSITGQGGIVVLSIPILDSSDHISSGIVQMRFDHVENGIASHKLLIDFVQLVSGASSLSSIDHDALAGRNSVLNHPWAMPINSSNNLTTTGNVTAAFFLSTDNNTNASVQNVFNGAVNIKHALYVNGRAGTNTTSPFYLAGSSFEVTTGIGYSYNGGTGTGGAGGAIILNTQKGGDSYNGTASLGGAGGSFTSVLGAGGNGTYTSASIMVSGGNGGAYSFTAGYGGNASNYSSPTAGSGGGFTFTAGTGGIGRTNTGGSANNGTGGSFTFKIGQAANSNEVTKNGAFNIMLGTYQLLQLDGRGNLTLTGRMIVNNMTVVTRENYGLGLNGSIFWDGSNLNLNSTSRIDFLSNVSMENMTTTGRQNFGLSRNGSIFWDGANLVINSTGLIYTYNVSVSDIKTRTTVYDKTKGSALSKIKDASQYTTAASKINHTAFYGYSKGIMAENETTVYDYSVFCYIKTNIEIINNETNITTQQEICSATKPPKGIDGVTETKYYKTLYNYTTFDQVSLNDQVAMQQQAIYELKTELCLYRAYSWCT